MNKIQNFNAWISNLLFRITMFGKAKVQNSNVWKSETPELQCLEKPKSRIPIFGKAKI